MTASGSTLYRGLPLTVAAPISRARRAVVGLGEEAHLNTCFRHFVHFIMEFDLVNDEEQAPLREIIREMVHQRGV